MSVKPYDWSGWNMSLLQLFGVGPKFTITCGECRLTFKKRIPMVDHPGISCPGCETINVLPLQVKQTFDD